MEVQGEMYVCESVHVCVHLCVCMCAQVNVSTFREGFICERGGVWGVCGRPVTKMMMIIIINKHLALI